MLTNMKTISLVCFLFLNKNKQQTNNGWSLAPKYIHSPLVETDSFGFRTEVASVLQSKLEHYTSIMMIARTRLPWHELLNKKQYILHYCCDNMFIYVNILSQQ